MSVFDGNDEPGVSAVQRQPSGWTPMRRELLAWFRDRASSLAPAYEGAVQLLEDKDFPGRIHFIGHAVREIADRLVYALDPQLEGNRVQYENQMDVIEKEWPQMDSAGSSSTDFIAEGEVAIPVQLALRLNRLVQAHRERRKMPSPYERLFRYLMRNEPSGVQLNRRLVGQFKETRNWFMRLAHLRRSGPPQIDEAELQSHFSTFEGMLHSFAGNFFTGISQLDDILQDANRTTA